MPRIGSSAAGLHETLTMPGWASAPEGNEFLRVRRLTR